MDDENFVLVEVILPIVDGSQYAVKVIGGKGGHDGNLKGICNSKPVLYKRDNLFQ